MPRILLLLGALLFSRLPGCAQTYSITKYGAVGDGKTLSTVAIQQAIDACNRGGGGQVQVPAGTFLTGTLSLKSNVNLYLESGAVLKGSARLKDYRSYTLPVFGLNYYGVLYTEKAENVAVTGQGTIDGNDQAYFEWDKAKTLDTATTRYTRQKANYRHVVSGIGDGPVVPKDRPRQMIIFAQCKNVQVRNVSILHSPFWTMHFADCDAVLVSGIRLWTSMLVPNADGIDVTSSSNVTITDCDIRAGDDAIAIVGYDHHFEMSGFSGLRHVSENITISNCHLQSYSSGIRIGFLDQNTVRNVNVSNCNITNSTRGIGIFLRDEGSLENLTFTNINIETRLRTGDWWGNGEPIHISAIRGNEKVKLGKIRNVRFDNITCRGENGILVYGTEESVMEDLSFNHVTFDFVDSPLNGVAGGNVDLRGVLGEKNALFARDIPAFLAQYVNGLSVDNFKLRWVEPKSAFLTHGIETDHVQGLRVRNFQGTAAPNNPKASAVFLKSSADAVVDRSKKEVKRL
ncbi:MAG: right-handed parallel beta-helix repeat-containing protein [Hymenobacter sp.]|nr:right-handed parallel beta-helix repeat-containing protein [Hymenobacter sp.]